MGFPLQLRRPPPHLPSGLRGPGFSTVLTDSSSQQCGRPSPQVLCPHVSLKGAKHHRLKPSQRPSLQLPSPSLPVLGPRLGQGLDSSHWSEREQHLSWPHMELFDASVWLTNAGPCWEAVSGHPGAAWGEATAVGPLGATPSGLGDRGGSEGGTDSGLSLGPFLWDLPNVLRRPVRDAHHQRSVQPSPTACAAGLRAAQPSGQSSHSWCPRGSLSPWTLSFLCSVEALPTWPALLQDSWAVTV